MQEYVNRVCLNSLFRTKSQFSLNISVTYQWRISLNSWATLTDLARCFFINLMRNFLCCHFATSWLLKLKWDDAPVLLFFHKGYHEEFPFFVPFLHFCKGGSIISLVWGLKTRQSFKGTMNCHNTWEQSARAPNRCDREYCHGTVMQFLNCTNICSQLRYYYSPIQQ